MAGVGGWTLVILGLVCAVPLVLAAGALVFAVALDRKRRRQAESEWGQDDR